MHRLDNWLKKEWPSWDEEKEDTPDAFGGTVDCPICRQTFLVIGYHKKPFCFHCNVSVDAEECENCGTTYLASRGCLWCGKKDDQADTSQPATAKPFVRGKSQLPEGI
jgi:ribosomal protein L32